MARDGDSRYERNPDPARRFLSATEAGRLKGHGYRWVQDGIRSGTIQGGKHPGKNRWWAYIDAGPFTDAGPGAPAGDNSTGLHDTVTALTQLVKDLLDRDRERDQAVADIRAEAQAYRQERDRDAAAWRAEQMAYRERIIVLLSANADSDEGNAEILSGAMKIQLAKEKYRDELLQMHLPDFGPDE